MGDPILPNTPFQSDFPEKKRMTTGAKVCLLGLQCALLMIGAFAIWVMSYSRDERSMNVAEEIIGEWGDEVVINGPVLVKDLNSGYHQIPQTYDCEVNVHTQSLHRNIYEAEVFNAKAEISASFGKDVFNGESDTVYLKLEVPADRIVSNDKFSIGDYEGRWERTDGYLYAMLPKYLNPDNRAFHTEFEVQGSRSLYVYMIGEESSIAISGDARNPSFYGSKLPVERSIDKDYFKALWKSLSLAGNGNLTHTRPENFAKVYFLVGVDRYQKVSRSLKYALIIIVLTYISVFLTEIIRKREIPLLNYFLIGFALILFYSLLLAFSEFVNFGIAYLISSAMTIALITLYMWKMLKSRIVGMTIGVILLALYGCCYIMLIASTFALLFGSLLLFLVLGIMMYASLKIRLK